MGLFEFVVMIVCYWAVVLGFSVGASIAAAFVLIVFGRTSEKA